MISRSEPTVPSSPAQPESAVPSRNLDDWATIAAIGTLACITDTMLHEGVGHGGAALWSGASRIVMTTVSMNANLDNKWIEAAGTLVNLIAAAILWLLLRTAKIRAPRARYFLVLTFAFNVFSGTGYFLFSGVTDFGDWSVVIQGLQPHWLWRAALIAIGIAAYWFAIVLVGSLLRPYLGEKGGHSPRCRRLTWIPYVTAVALAACGSIFNPLGLPLLWQSALPATMGANAGMISMVNSIRPRPPQEDDPGPISRSVAWIAAAIVLALVYVLVVGCGVHLR